MHRGAQELRGAPVGKHCGRPSKLIRKLYAYGIRGNTFNWLKSYIIERSQYVIYYSKQSETQTIKCGVPHGSILGHIFLVYILTIPAMHQSYCFPSCMPIKGRLRLLGAPDWNLESGPISNEERVENIYILRFGATKWWRLLDFSQSTPPPFNPPLMAMTHLSIPNILSF